jgi:triosephosphate isomerase (TIM)
MRFSPMEKMNVPIIIVNFKTYGKSTGENAIALAKICERSSRNGKALVIAAVQASDISKISEAAKIPVFAQHVDCITPGKNTGFILPEAVMAAGAAGTLLNHSEHRLEKNVLAETIKLCRGKLTTVVCAKDAKEAAEISKLEPDFIAVEIPELISGKVSISKANPKLVSDAVEAVHKVKNIPVLAGAGVQDGSDVKKAIELGARGVLIANAVVNSENPEKVVKDLVSAN